MASVCQFRASYTVFRYFSRAESSRAALPSLRLEWYGRVESDFVRLGLRPRIYVKFLYAMTMWARQAHAAALVNGAGDIGKLTSVLFVDVTCSAARPTRCLRLSGVGLRSGLPLEHLQHQRQRQLPNGPSKTEKSSRSLQTLLTAILRRVPRFSRKVG